MNRRMALLAFVALVAMTSTAKATCEPWPHCTYSTTRHNHHKNVNSFGSIDMNGLSQVFAIGSFVPGPVGMGFGIAGTVIGLVAPQQKQAPPQQVIVRNGASEKRKNALAHQEMKRVWFPKMLAAHLTETNQMLVPQWKATPIPDDETPKTTPKAPAQKKTTSDDGKVLPTLVSQSFTRAGIVLASNTTVVPTMSRLQGFAEAINKLRIKESKQPARQQDAYLDTSNIQRLVIAMSE